MQQIVSADRLVRRRRRGPVLDQKLPMKIGEAKMVVLGSNQSNLGQPSKLPGHSWGISAQTCQRGSKLAKVPGSVCSGCYARKNFYATWKPVQVAHERRAANIDHPLWVDAMVTLITRYTEPDEPYFRWFDSGDLQSADQLARIAEVCRRTPGVSHWLATHEPFMVRQFLASGGVIPSNLCLRISADMVDEPPEAVDGLAHLPTSTVHSGHGNDRVVQVSGHRRDSIECKAYTATTRKGAAGTCRNCRACWDPRVKNISYPVH